MGTEADDDLWARVLAIENRYGDRGPGVLTRRIEALRATGASIEAERWSQVATCLDELHAIRFGEISSSAFGAARGEAAGRDVRGQSRDGAVPDHGSTWSQDHGAPAGRAERASRFSQRWSRDYDR